MQISDIKQAARLNLKGKYLRCVFTNVLYIIVLMILSLLLSLISVPLESHATPLLIVEAIFAVVSLILSFGFISNIIALTKDETNSMAEFLKSSVTNSLKYLKIFLQVLLRVIIPFAVFLLAYFYFFGTFLAYYYSTNYLCFYSNQLPLAIILFIVAIVLVLYFVLQYILTPYVCKNNNDLSAKEVTLKSKSLMKKHEVKYILLLLSFFGWVLLAAVICWILSYFVSTTFLTIVILIFYALIRPYIISSEQIFYESLDDNAEIEKDVNKEV